MCALQLVCTKSKCVVDGKVKQNKLSANWTQTMALALNANRWRHRPHPHSSRPMEFSPLSSYQSNRTYVRAACMAFPIILHCVVGPSTIPIELLTLTTSSSFYRQLLRPSDNTTPKHSQHTLRTVETLIRPKTLDLHTAPTHCLCHTRLSHRTKRGV